MSALTQAEKDRYQAAVETETAKHAHLSTILPHPPPIEGHVPQSCIPDATDDLEKGGGRLILPGPPD